MNSYRLENPQEGYKLLKRVGDKEFIVISALTIDGVESKLAAIARAVEAFKASGSSGFGQSDYIPFLRLDNYTFRNVAEVDEHLKVINDLRENCHSYYVSSPDFIHAGCIQVKEQSGRGFARSILIFNDIGEAESTLQGFSEFIAKCREQK